MKRGQALTRRTRISRVKGLRPRRPGAPRRSSRVLDPAYLAAVRAMPCCLRRLHPHAHFCVGPIEPHHATHGRGYGQRSDDKTAIPLCRAAHDDLHLFRGFFAGWTREERAAWHDARAEETGREIERRAKAPEVVW